MLFVTTSHRPGPEDWALAETFSARLEAPLYKREGSLARMFRHYGAEQAVVVTVENPRWESVDGEQFRFHPSMAAVRVRQLRKGGEDSLISVSGIRRGDRVLDCTLGLGADAIVAAHAVGEEGRVTGLESRPVIAELVRYGLQTYSADSPALVRAMRAVEVIRTDHRDFLRQCPDDAYDVILFDPMFRRTVKKSAAMQSLRPLANPDPLDRAAVREAVRVARRRVVLKERRGSGEFARLGFEVVKEASSYALGIIDPARGGNA